MVINIALFVLAATNFLFSLILLGLQNRVKRLERKWNTKQNDDERGSTCSIVGKGRNKSGCMNIYKIMNY